MANKNVNEMDYSKRRRICEILDIDQQWKLLASEIGLSVDKIMHLEFAILRLGGSPSSDLLTLWSHSNATVEMLASYLLRLNLRRAAEHLRGIVPDSMFDTSLNPDMNSGNEQELQSLPTPSQAATNYVVGLCQMNGLPDYKPIKSTVADHSMSCSQFHDWEQQKPNIAMQNSVSFRPAQKPSGRVQPLDTWSENMTPSFEFYPPNQSGKISEEIWSQRSTEYGRVPVESPDASSFVPNSDSPRNQLQNQKPAETIGPVSLSSFMICYPYNDIFAATNSFASDNLLGRGGFGNVYRGNIKKTTFAIKVLHKKENPANCRDFLAEINSLQKFRQKNIIILSGCSIDGPSVCLIYEYMVNGSLQDRLECKSNTKPLLWKIRHSILKDAAAGLQYLHTVDVKPLIHGDIKSANILLGPHFEAKISDFGLAKEATGGTVTGKLTHVTRSDFEKVYGSRAYLPEDFFTGGFQFNLKTDTYSFGIVIFETCTGQRPDDPRREGGKLLGDYVRNTATNKNSHLLEIKDKNSLMWPDKLWLEVMTLGLSCTAETKKNRPHMTKVYEELETLHQEMQLLKRLQRKTGSGDGFASQSEFSGSEKSYHLSHQSRPTTNHSLAAENTIPLDDVIAPYELQKSFDSVKQNGYVSQETHAFRNPVIDDDRDLQKLHEIDEAFVELSVADDGSKVNNLTPQSQVRHAVQHAVVPDFFSDDQESDSSLEFLNIQEQCFKGVVSSVYKSDFDEKDTWPIEPSKLNYKFECIQNCKNEQKEGGIENEPGGLFLKWHQEERCKEFDGTCCSEIVVSEQLEKIKQKKLPILTDSVSSQSNEMILSEEIVQIKKKELPGYINLFGDHNYPEDGGKYENSEIQEGHIQDNNIAFSTTSAFSGLGTNCLPHRPCFPPTSFTDFERLYDFVPPECSMDESSSVSAFTETKCSESGARPLLIAKEDLLRVEKLEQLKQRRLKKS